jgi:hypothetical protein
MVELDGKWKMEKDHHQQLMINHLEEDLINQKIIKIIQMLLLEHQQVVKLIQINHQVNGLILH